MLKSEYFYRRRFLNRFASVAGRPMVWGVWNVIVYGPNIHLGKNCVIVGADGFRTTLTTVSYNGHQGSIKIGDNVLIMNGVRVSSASEIVIGDDCMLANFCYIMDADWHDIYDRTSSPGKTAPVILERGVWVGDSAIICKGVRIGENSIIGAGSVVRKDVPPNCVVIGNPARIVKKLDPARVVTMGKLYETENLKHKGK
ncbi:MAG TPA: acyltransferase [Spirochaetota bacterium]|nr:acyltransferase [Spirochaetota bacterium]